jgi:plastocyanin
LAGCVAGAGAAVLFVLGACDDTDLIVGVGGGSGDARADALFIVSGDLQNGRTSEVLGQSLIVQAQAGSVPVPDVEILWTITRGVATLSWSSSVTDEQGEASVLVTPGPLLGEIEVTATIAGDGGESVEFDIRTTVVLIEILIDRFEVPLGGDSVEVVLGDTIEWVNRDALRHSVVSTAVPDGAAGFISGSLGNSERYRLVAKVEGIYVYEDSLSIQPVAPSGTVSVVGQEVGALRVATSTAGTNMDRDFVVTVDGQRSSAIGPSDAVVFPALSATAHAVRLVDVLENCAVDENPRSVTVVAGDTVSTTFDVVCE